MGNQRVIVLLGPPGSGKGTQAVRLAKELKIPHVSTGDLFRYNIKTGTELGKRAKGFIDAGQLVPDDLVLDMLNEEVAKEPYAVGYVLDGLPRTLHQAKELDRRLSAKPVMIYLDVRDEVIVERITGRLNCRECGAPYHKQFHPPKKEALCDQCGGALYARADDREEIVRNRLEIYHQETEPVVLYYREKGELHEVEGTRTPDEVYTSIREIAGSS